MYKVYPPITIKLEINNRKKMVKFTNIWKLNKTLLKINESTKKSQGELENTFRWMNENTQYTQTIWLQ